MAAASKFKKYTHINMPAPQPARCSFPHTRHGRVHAEQLFFLKFGRGEPETSDGLATSCCVPVRRWLPTLGLSLLAREAGEEEPGWPRPPPQPWPPGPAPHGLASAWAWSPAGCGLVASKGLARSVL